VVKYNYSRGWRRRFSKCYIDNRCIYVYIDGIDRKWKWLIITSIKSMKFWNVTQLVRCASIVIVIVMVRYSYCYVYRSVYCVSSCLSVYSLCVNVYCTLLYCTVLYCTVLYCTVLYCTVLYCTVLYCTVLYCTVL